MSTRVADARAWWSRLWDGETASLPLAMVRVGVAAVVLVRTSDWLAPLLTLDHHGWVRGLEYAPWVDGATEQPVLRSPLLPFIPRIEGIAASVLVFARTALAALLLLGVRARFSAAALAVAGWTLMAADRFRYMHHLHFLWLTCGLLALCACGERLSVERWLRDRDGRAVVPRWPLELLRFLVVIAYLSAGASKLRGEWLDGTILDALAGEGLVDGTLWEIGSDAVGAAGVAVLVCAVELVIPVLLVIRKTRTWAVGLAIAFHLAIGATMVVSTFGVQMALLLLLFLPWTERPIR